MLQSTRKLFVLSDGDGTVSVVRNPMDGDVVICEVLLSERATQAYDLFEMMREMFGDSADSPLYSLLDEVASAMNSCGNSG